MPVYFRALWNGACNRADGIRQKTTLYAALNEIKNTEDKIITIEAPIEYQVQGITQIPVNEKKGLTFALGYAFNPAP